MNLEKLLIGHQEIPDSSVISRADLSCFQDPYSIEVDHNEQRIWKLKNIAKACGFVKKIIHDFVDTNITMRLEEALTHESKQTENEYEGVKITKINRKYFRKKIENFTQKNYISVSETIDDDQEQTKQLKRRTTTERLARDQSVFYRKITAEYSDGFKKIIEDNVPDEITKITKKSQNCQKIIEIRHQDNLKVIIIENNQIPSTIKKVMVIHNLNENLNEQDNNQTEKSLPVVLYFRGTTETAEMLKNKSMLTEIAKKQPVMMVEVDDDINPKDRAPIVLKFLEQGHLKHLGEIGRVIQQRINNGKMVLDGFSLGTVVATRFADLLFKNISPQYRELSKSWQEQIMETIMINAQERLPIPISSSLEPLLKKIHQKLQAPRFDTTNLPKNISKLNLFAPPFGNENDSVLQLGIRIGVEVAKIPYILESDNALEALRKISHGCKSALSILNILKIGSYVVDNKIRDICPILALLNKTGLEINYVQGENDWVTTKKAIENIISSANGCVNNTKVQGVSHTDFVLNAHKPVIQKHLLQTHHEPDDTIESLLTDGAFDEQKAFSLKN